MLKQDRELLEMIIKEPKRYEVCIDIDEVWVVDKWDKDEIGAMTIYPFKEAGVNLLVELFEFLGFEAGGV